MASAVSAFVDLIVWLSVQGPSLGQLTLVADVEQLAGLVLVWDYCLAREVDGAMLYLPDPVCQRFYQYLAAFVSVSVHRLR